MVHSPWRWPFPRVSYTRTRLAQPVVGSFLSEAQETGGRTTDLVNQWISGSAIKPNPLRQQSQACGPLCPITASSGMGIFRVGVGRLYATYTRYTTHIWSRHAHQHWASATHINHTWPAQTMSLASVNAHWRPSMHPDNRGNKCMETPNWYDQSCFSAFLGSTVLQGHPRLTASNSSPSADLTSRVASRVRLL